MDIFILGMGHVGKALAHDCGSPVTGSRAAPPPRKSQRTGAARDRVVILRGSETENWPGPPSVVMRLSSPWRPMCAIPARSKNATSITPMCWWPVATAPASPVRT